jgi:hypothetical protein
MISLGERGGLLVRSHGVQFATQLTDAWRKWTDRAAYSPCQKGIRAGAPGAGVTITRSCSIALTRHVEDPS